jgi:hypothetical protein
VKAGPTAGVVGVIAVMIEKVASIMAVWIYPVICAGAVMAVRVANSMFLRTKPLTKSFTLGSGENAQLYPDYQPCWDAWFPRV